MATIVVEKRIRTQVTDSWGEWVATTDVPPYTNTELVEYRTIGEGSIELKDLTTGSIDGDGVFDELMRSVNLHIDDQWAKGRIKGSDYATVYLGGLQSTLAQSVTFLLQKSKSEKEVESQAAQIALYNRQREGFDDNKYQKLFESQMSTWGLMFSSGLLTEKPAVITSDKASALYTKLTENL